MTIQDYRNASIRLQEFTAWSRKERSKRNPKSLMLAKGIIKIMTEAAISIKQFAEAIKQLPKLKI